MASTKYKIDKSIFDSMNGGLIGGTYEPDNDTIYDVAELPFDLTDFLLQINGLSYNGIEIFTLEEGSLCTDDGTYCVPDIFLFSKRFERERIDVTDLFLPVGRSDEDIYLYTYETEKYSVNDRIDLMEYESFDDFISLLQHVLAERGYTVNFEIIK